MANTSKAFPHWPVFDGPLTAQMTDRQLMGLGTHFQSGLNLALPLAEWQQLTQAPASVLCRRVEDPQSPLPLRLAAGRYLAETIDPRLDVLNPPMIRIEGGWIDTGLDEAKVDSVMDRMQGLGPGSQLDRKGSAAPHRAVAALRHRQIPGHQPGIQSLSRRFAGAAHTG